MEYRSPKTFSYLAMGSIGATGLLQIFSLVIGIAQIVSPESRLAATESLWIVLQAFIALFEFPILILSIIFFLMWLYRGYTNLGPLRSLGSEFTPGWAIGWWFVPFVNLVKPFQVVRNLWAESDPEIDPDGFNLNVQAGAPAFMLIWWITWLIANFVSNLSSGAMESKSANDVAASGYIFIVHAAFHVTASALAIMVIRSITARQEERHERTGDLRPSAPPPPPVFQPDPA